MTGSSSFCWFPLRAYCARQAPGRYAVRLEVEGAVCCAVAVAPARSCEVERAPAASADSATVFVPRRGSSPTLAGRREGEARSLGSRCCGRRRREYESRGTAGAQDRKTSPTHWHSITCTNQHDAETGGASAASARSAVLLGHSLCLA
eukprot:1153416-Pleurochrysis_carterae.AAC.2